MKQIFALLFSSLITLNLLAQVNPNHHYVRTYIKSNGTVVQGHNQTNPNQTINDNYSTYPNINPYTGKQGTIAPIYPANSGSNSSATHYPVYTPPTPPSNPTNTDYNIPQ